MVSEKRKKEVEYRLCALEEAVNNMYLVIETFAEALEQLDKRQRGKK